VRKPHKSSGAGVQRTCASRTKAGTGSLSETAIPIDRGVASAGRSAALFHLGTGLHARPRIHAIGNACLHATLIPVASAAKKLSRESPFADESAPTNARSRVDGHRVGDARPMWSGSRWPKAISREEALP